jgi:16S rRNA (cytosine1402-N4)-methyltransferase
MKSVHKSVLLQESIEGLAIKDDAVIVDGTFGGGGHSKEILEKFPKAKVIAIDQDKTAWDKAKDKFQGLEKRIAFKNGNFRDIKNVLEISGVGHLKSGCPTPKIDGVLLDLGLSSDQLENSGRGFTFMKDEPLLMTMKADPLPEDVTAKEIVNEWEEGNLADIIYGYGEERFARRIAKGIVEARKVSEIKSTFQLVEIIKSSVPAPYRKGKIHPATKTFQALRIAVNDELNTLMKGLEDGFEILKGGGRMSVISFHSLEDRIVKRFFKRLNDEKRAILINKKPIVASQEELKENPTKELSIEGEDFVLLSRETYYKLKEYEAMCSGLL